MADTDRLRDLLHEMERARSPLQRLRLVALAWRTVRGLSRQEREDIALRVGMAEAGELVERLATRDGGVAPTELLEAIHAAETADPGKLRQMVGGLRGAMRDPEQRRDLLHRAADALDAAAAQVAVPASPAQAFTPPEGLPRPEPTATVVKPVPQPLLPSRPAAALPSRTRPSPPSAASARPAPSPTRSTPLQEASAVPPPPPRVPPALATLSAPAPEATPRVSRYGLVERLTALRRRAGLLQAEGLERLRHEVDAVPAGWPRRRALCALLEEGVPATVDVALELVDGLGRERDRAWCLGTLVRTRRLTDRELDAALELVSSPTTRARLRRLAASFDQTP